MKKLPRFVTMNEISGDSVVKSWPTLDDATKHALSGAALGVRVSIFVEIAAAVPGEPRLEVVS